MGKGTESKINMTPAWPLDPELCQSPCTSSHARLLKSFTLKLFFSWRTSIQKSLRQGAALN